MFLILSFLNEVLDNLYTLIDTKHTAVQTDVVIRSISPLEICEVLVVSSSLLILLLKSLLRLLIALAVQLYDTLSAELGVSTDIYIKDAVVVFKDKVS